jgi:hypothetical protein
MAWKIANATAGHAVAVSIAALASAPMIACGGDAGHGSAVSSTDPGPPATGPGGRGAVATLPSGARNGPRGVALLGRSFLGQASAPFRFTPTIDGSLADWTSGPPGTALSSFRHAHGYFAYDASNYYFAYDMNPTSNGYADTIYIGDGGSAAGGTTALLPADTCSTSPGQLPTGMNAEYAFSVTTAGQAVSAHHWNEDTAAWESASFPVEVAASGAAIEMSVPIASLGNITVPNVLGVLVANVGQTDCAAAARAGADDTWPGPTGMYSVFAACNMASSQPPDADLEE